MAGYIRISREIFDDPAFASVKFSRTWALIDLIQMAKYKAGTEFVNGRPISLERGQLCKSIRWLAARWKWDEKTVSSFISSLEIGGVITKIIPRSKGGLTNIISIVNYDCFDVDSNTDSHEMSDTDSDAPSHALYIENKKEYNTSDTKVSSYSILKEEKKKEEDTDVSSKKEQTDFSFVLDLWNSFAKRNVPKVRSLTQARRDKVKLRIKEMGGIEESKTILAECFKKISESDFCTGTNGEWAANFDWFFRNEEIWHKVLEGNYDNRKKKSQLEILAENIAKADAYYEQRYHGYGGASAYGNQEGGRDYGPDEQ